ncbi:MAG: 50S ribosomal protein L19e [Candidatus Asgardarchaeia archaeon]
MSVRIQRRMVARMLGVGVERVWIDPERVDEVSLAIRKEDLRKLIHDGAIKIKSIKGTSRSRARILHMKKKKGLRRGHGSRKGKKTARLSSKRIWVNKVRALRKYIRKLKEKGYIDVRTYRTLYIKASSGVFHSVRHIRMHLLEQGILKEREQSG